MRIVTDAAANLTPEKVQELGIEVVPFQVTFLGETYRDGSDFRPEDLYELYSQHPNDFSQTSQPSVGDFVSAYERPGDDEILSIHLSSGLSGAYSSAEHAARMVPGKKVIVIDSRTVGPALGWMVEAAAYGIKKGWTKERILDAVQQVKDNTITMVAFTELSHLVHSGRVSHLKGIIAAILKLKPIIGMNDEDGRYSNLGQEVTLQRLVKKMASIVHQRFGDTRLRVQFMHGKNAAGAEMLKNAVMGVFDIVEDKLVPVTLVLGAHAGPTVFGLAAIPQSIFDSLYQA